MKHGEIFKTQTIAKKGEEKLPILIKATQLKSIRGNITMEKP